ncbi:MAG: hypothetical protein H0W08_15855 [Acidobacteria bacterium]|nr:hypothetical protein [Acidobacteriota bacterium]
MGRSLRREIRFLRVYAITNSLILVVLCTAAFRQAATGAHWEIVRDLAASR